MPRGRFGFCCPVVLPHSLCPAKMEGTCERAGASFQGFLYLPPRLRVNPFFIPLDVTCTVDGKVNLQRKIHFCRKPV